VVIFRIDSITGPFESYPGNPILTNRDLDPARPDPITCTGHGDLVQTRTGEWWMVLLACRPGPPPEPRTVAIVDNPRRIAPAAMNAAIRAARGWIVVRVDGQRSVYLPVLKQGGDTNTIAVVDGVKHAVGSLLDVPAELMTKVVFDQSQFVKTAIETLLHEGAIGQALRIWPRENQAPFLRTAVAMGEGVDERYPPN